MTNSVTFKVPAVTATDTATGATLSVPAYSITVAVAAATPPITTPPVTTPPVTTPPVTTPPVTTPPTTGKVTWMYLNGVKTLSGDFTGSGTQVNYNHTVTGAQLNGGTKDIQLTTSGAGVQWPYFLPYFSADYKLPNPGWTSLLISIKPTVTGQAFGVHMERVGDQPLQSVELLAYGPATVAGKWSSYVIPLKDLGTYGDATLYKALFQDHSADSAGFEVDALGFQ